MPMLFKKNNNSLNMVPLQGGTEVRALQILRTLSISIQQTEQSDEAVVVDKDSTNTIQMPIPTQGNVPPVAAIPPCYPNPLDTQESQISKHKIACFICLKPFKTVDVLRLYLNDFHNTTMIWPCHKCMEHHIHRTALKFYLHSHHGMYAHLAETLSRESELIFIQEKLGVVYTITDKDVSDNVIFHQASRQLQCESDSTDACYRWWHRMDKNHVVLHP